MSTLTKWCQENHFSVNIDKTKELVVDFRRQSREHTPITIDKTPVEQVNRFKFLGVHITEDLTWSAHTDAVLKKAHQRLFFLRRLRKFGTSPSILRSFYTFTFFFPDGQRASCFKQKSTHKSNKILKKSNQS